MLRSRLLPPGTLTTHTGLFPSTAVRGPHSRWAVIYSPWTIWPLEPRDASGSPMGEGRPEGLHLGDIIRAMRAERGEVGGAIPGEQEAVRLQAGFLHEAAVEYIAAGMPQDLALELAFKRYMRPLRAGVAKQVRAEKDGILMTPDGVDTIGGVLESYKCVAPET